MTTTSEPIIDAGFVGKLTDDPTLHFSASGVAYLRGRIGVRPYVPKGDPAPETDYYDLVAFGGLAEHVAEVCRKGDRVVVSGRIEHSTWTGNDGQERTTQGIVADGIGPDLRFTTAEVARTRRSDAPAVGNIAEVGAQHAAPTTTSEAL